jgi:hypothetical protein
MSRGWVFAPHSGGRKAPPSVQEEIRNRIVAYAQANYKGSFNPIDVRLRGQFFYVDAYVEPSVSDNFNEELYGESREEHIEVARNTSPASSPLGAGPALRKRLSQLVPCI